MSAPTLSPGYARAWAALPENLRRERASAWQHFERLGFPDRRLEDWRYTDLHALAQADFAIAAASAAPTVDALPGFTLLHFHNGLRVTGTAAAPGAPLADDGVTALNAALHRDGFELRLGRHQQQAPVQLVVSQSGALMSHLRHRLVLDTGADATVLLDLRSDEAAGLTTSVLEIELGPNSRLQLLRLQDYGSATTELARTQVQVQRDARLDYVGFDLGGGLVRHDLNVNLAEPGATVELHGVFAPGGRTHFDTHTRIHHAAPHTTSRELIRGLVRDKANAVFNGRIVVEKGAQKTDSEQSIASLLLAPGAQINAKPELEIYADDVKCAHGATCGQLDETAVYYLRSRGLDRDTACNVLLYTFAHPVLSRVADAGARAEFRRRLLQRLPGADSLEELA